MTRYLQVIASATYKSNGTSITTQIPTFYLDAGVQGIITIKQASYIVSQIVNPFNNLEIEVNCTVTELY